MCKKVEDDQHHDVLVRQGTSSSTDSQSGDGKFGSGTKRKRSSSECSLPMEESLQADHKEPPVAINSVVALESGTNDPVERPTKQLRLRCKTKAENTIYGTGPPAQHSSSRSTSDPIGRLQQAATQLVEQQGKRKRGRPQGSKDPMSQAGLKRQRPGKRSSMSIWTKMQLFKVPCHFHPVVVPLESI